MKPERGAALVEAAFVILFLVVLAMGIADLGRALSAQIRLQDAVSEGALFGTETPNLPGAVRARVIDSAGASTPLTPSDVTIECDNPKTIKVTATYDVEMITFVGRWFGSSITLSPNAVGTVITADTCVAAP